MMVKGSSMSNNRYLEGDCHVMAVALHRNINTSFLLLCERSNDYRNPETKTPVPAVHHVYAARKDGAILDIRGEYDAANVKSQWLSLGDGRRTNPFYVIEVADEKALRHFVDDGWELPLTSYSEEDVNSAWEVFQSAHAILLDGVTLKR